MTTKVTIIDYGSGNILSVTRAVERCGAQAVVSSDPTVIVRADRLILPGVGAFEDGMRGLRERDLIDAILDFSNTGRPLLGICLGMQMLATLGQEFGEHPGLNLIPGRVVAIPSRDAQGLNLRIPHIGWSDVFPSAAGRWAGTIFDATPVGTSVYLVHSYQFVPDNTAHRLAECYYGGHQIAAAVEHNNVVGCQFHPEKSAEAGLALLAAFLRR